MGGVKNTSLLYIIPLIAFLAIPVFCGNVYAVTRARGDGKEVTWSHVYPQTGGIYHPHVVGYFAWSVWWDDAFPGIGFHGYIYMVGSVSAKTWYCGDQLFYSRLNRMVYKVEVIKIKDLTNQTEYTDPNLIRNILHFHFGYVWPQGSWFLNELNNLLWGVFQSITGLSRFTDTRTAWGEVTAYSIIGNKSEFSIDVEFSYFGGLDPTHTYEVTCRLTWCAIISIWVERDPRVISSIDQETSPQYNRAIDTVYEYATTDITFIIKPW